MTKEEKEVIVERFGRHSGDTGCCEVQVALLTKRINDLTEHLKIHRNDRHSRRGLFVMIGQRRNLLNYLMKCGVERFRIVTEALGIRK
ncbi:MAG: 30S ribosomal protein S15 [Oscillospiraceae bacterium]|jgi:small subunit ribosomal protein S15|nr:30S ribosomal protein S15 [Oscillospiraceae bacterium]